MRFNRMFAWSCDAVNNRLKGSMGSQREQDAMGTMLHNIHIGEYRAALLHEREFAEVARTLKALAADLEVPAAPVLDALVHHGIDAALDLLSDLSHLNASCAHYRHRGSWRAKHGGVPTVH